MRTVFQRFNRGQISELLLGRDDVERVNNSAKEMDNWLPRRAGPMSYRPGFEFKLDVGEEAFYIPFVRSIDDTALIELTYNVMRVVVDDAYVAAATVTTAVTNGSFASVNAKAIEGITQANPAVVTITGHGFSNGDVIFIEDVVGMTEVNDRSFTVAGAAANTFQLSGEDSTAYTAWSSAGTASNVNITGWTDGSSGTAEAIACTDGARIIGDGTNEGILYQTWGSTDTGNEHTLSVKVERSPVYIRLGTGGVSSDGLYEGWLGVGHHSLVFTPSSNVTVTFSTNKRYSSVVSEIKLLTTGTVEWDTNISDYDGVRYDQSADVIYIAQSNAGAQYQIERRGTKSWSIVEYRSSDGPYKTINDTPITLTAAALNGDTTLTASEAYFKSGHVGALFKLISNGQVVTGNFTAISQETDPIYVFGVNESRYFTITITGTATATVILEKSADEVNWEVAHSWSSASTFAVSQEWHDNLDNAYLYYKFSCSAYTSGTVVATLTYASGSLTGIARAYERLSATAMKVQMLQAAGTTTATRDWYEGEWCNRNDYPTAVTMFEGRLFWAGQNALYGSVSDVYNLFDIDREGDDKAITKTIGFGPVDEILWLAKASRLRLGLASHVLPVRSSSYGEVLTQTNLNIRNSASVGASGVAPVALNDQLYFVDRTGRRLQSLIYAWGNDADEVFDCNLLAPDLNATDIKRLMVTVHPEPRVWVLLNSGQLRVYLVDDHEEVRAWSVITVTGDVKDICVIPNTNRDLPYVLINRGSKYTLERLAIDSLAVGASKSMHYDGQVYTASPGSTTISGLDHLNGYNVYAWCDGTEEGPYTVSSGSITISSNAFTDVTVGIRFTADYKSMKPVSYASGRRTVFGELSQITDVALILQDYIPGVLTYGPSFDDLDNMPAFEEGDTAETQYDNYDMVPIEFYGDMTVDPRICLRATGPVTVQAIAYNIENEFTEDRPTATQSLSSALPSRPGAHRARSDNGDE